MPLHLYPPAERATRRPATRARRRPVPIDLRVTHAATAGLALLPRLFDALLAPLLHPFRSTTRGTSSKNTPRVTYSMAELPDAPLLARPRRTDPQRERDLRSRERRPSRRGRQRPNLITTPPASERGTSGGGTNGENPERLRDGTRWWMVVLNITEPSRNSPDTHYQDLALTPAEPPMPPEPAEPAFPAAPPLPPEPL